MHTWKRKEISIRQHPPTAGRSPREFLQICPFMQSLTADDLKAIFKRFAQEK